MHIFTILFWAYLLYSTAAYATIYKCERTDRSIYYQAKFCSDVADIQTTLNFSTTELSPQQQKQLQRNSHQQRQQILKTRQREQRLKKAAAKNHQVEQRRRLRAKTKCANVQRKIAEITQHYRTGYTVKQGVILDRKLAECQEQRQKYCNNE